MASTDLSFTTEEPDLRADDAAPDDLNSSDLADAAPLDGTPGKPTDVAAAAGASSASATWSTPSSSGSSPITSYTLTATPGGMRVTLPATVNFGTITGLTNGTSYTLSVHATNAVGDGPESDPSNAVIPTASAAVPDAPTAVQAVADHPLGATVTWTQPASNHGSNVLTYTVTANPGGASTTVIGVGTTMAVITGVPVGAHTFTVHATNGIGNSAESTPSNSVQIGNVPNAPSILTATAISGDRATVTWIDPVSDANHPILGYTVTSTPGGFTGTISGASATSATVTGLVGGTSYAFTVHATNDLGNSAESGFSSAVFAGDVPDAPVIGTATAIAADKATVTWTDPTNDVNHAIVSYTVTSTPGNFTITVSNATATTATVSGLVTGTSYTFTVHATNDLGKGAESSASNAIFGGVVPAAPTNASASALAGLQAHVTWTLPASDVHHPITGYTITSTPAGLGTTVSGAGTNNATFGGLASDVSYTFTVHATNDLGSSVESAATGAIYGGDVPGAPTIGTATKLSGGRAIVTWSAPTAPVHHPVTGYTITSAAAGSVSVGAATSGVMSGLANGFSYNFSVTATNDLGTGAASQLSNSIVATTGIVDTLYVNEYSANKVEIFEQVSTVPSSTTPTRSISGAATLISGPAEAGVFVDAPGNSLYLTNQTSSAGTPEVLVWNNAATIGTPGNVNVAPNRTIVGSNTGLTGSVARGIYYDRTHDRLYVSGRDYVVGYSSGGSVNGNQGYNFKLTGVTYVDQLFVDEANDILYIANDGNILVFNGASTLNSNPTASSANRTITVSGDSAHLAVWGDTSINTLYTVLSSSQATNAIYHLPNATTLNGTVTATAGQTLSNVSGVSSTSAIVVVNNVLYAAMDGSANIAIWNSASTLSGTTAPSKTLTATGGVYGLFYVP